MGVRLGAQFWVLGAPSGALWTSFVEEDAEPSPHGICAGLRGEPSPASLYDQANKVSPAQCNDVMIISHTDGSVLDWMELFDNLSIWLRLPLDAWPWDQVGEAAFRYTQCVDLCGRGANPGMRRLGPQIS